MQDFEQKVAQAAEAMKDIVGSPRIGIFINSEFEQLAYHLENMDIISCWDIPNFPQSLASNYENMIVGTIQGKTIICIYNNSNNFKGIPEQDIKFSIELLNKIGIKSIIFTSAIETTDNKFDLGDLVLIKEHIDISGKKYDFSKAEMLELARAMAQILNIDLKEATYKDRQKVDETKNNGVHGCKVTGISTIDEIYMADQYNISILEISYIISLADNFITQDSKTSFKLKQAKENLMTLFKEIIAVL